MVRGVTLALLPIVLATCGSATAPSSQGGATITFTATGLSAQEVSINRGNRVVFVNDDSKPHRPASNPHPGHENCPELNVGTIEAGHRVESAVMNAGRRCGFHDDLNLGNPAFEGRVLVGVQ
jgi:hypothetical protein